MKRSLFFIFLLSIPLLAWALTTSMFSAGNWNDPGNWNSGNIGDDIGEDVVFDDNLGLITIKTGDSYTIGALDMQNGNTLIIEPGSSLTIGSNFISKDLDGANLSVLTIGGNLEIWGSLNLNNTLSLEISGTLIIHDDLNGGNDLVVIVDGILDVADDINIGNGSTLEGTGTVNITGTCNGPDSFCDSGPLATLPPVIKDCPTDISLSLSGNDCDESVVWVEPTASDKEGIASFTSTHKPGDLFPLGSTVVTYTAINLSGKTATCSFDVKITDDTPPVISNCPTDIVVSISGNGCDEKIVWAIPLVTDNCQVDSFTSSHIPGDVFPLGTTVVTYTAKDPSGNTSQCSFNVTVNDNTDPVISNCPADQVVSTTLATDCDATVTWALPSASDNCSVASFTSTHKSGDAFPFGTTTVIYTATDPAGNTATCSFKITVNDIIPPVFDSCATNVRADEFDLVSQKAVVKWTEPLVSDNCTMPVVTSNFSSGDSFPAGKTIVIYTAVDKSGNTAKCEFTVEVIGNKVPVAASPLFLASYSGDPLDICLKVEDPDRDNLMITEVNYDVLNGIIEPFTIDDGKLCFIYTSFDDFEGEQLFYVTVCDDGVPTACTKVEVRIRVTLDLKLTVYKAFTPNNDNINDVWVIENIENYPDNHVMIFDRLGGLVFSAKGYNNSDVVWDGRSNQNGQNIAPSGTYFYKIDLGNDLPTPKGYIELKR